MHKSLEPLLQQTPSGSQKLLEAWGHLDDITAIYVISTLIERTRQLSIVFLEKAISHENPYIRYLAAKNFHDSYHYNKNNEYSDDEIVEKEIHKKLTQDNSKLVRATINIPDKWYELNEERPEDVFFCLRSNNATGFYCHRYSSRSFYPHT